MRTVCRIVLCLFLLGAATSGIAQAGKSGSAPVPASRYFQITLNLKFTQVPVGTGSATRYVELGTKLDCNDVHIEGDGIALEFVLEASGLIGTAKTKGSDGVVFDEPLITQRSVQLSVKLPLDQPKVVFDSSARPLTPLKQP